MTKKIYIAGPMRGIPYFNFPAFFEAEEMYQNWGYEVFNPARRDNEKYGTDISAGNLNGHQAEAELNHGFSLREALAADCKFICEEADTIAMLPGWENSLGANAEWSLAKALGLEINYIAPEAFTNV